jgi:Animal haem peroxidase
MSDSNGAPDRSSESSGRRYSRRGFLGRAGLGAGAVAASGATGLLRPSPAVGDPPPPNPLNFGRMFPNLPSFAPRPSSSLLDALQEVGRPGGIMDANDNLTFPNAPVELIVNPALNLVNINNTTHTAGTTFVGQFLDHDITFDTVSQLGIEAVPEDTRNARVPTLDLDAVYGGGPLVSPQLYERGHDRAKLRIESGGLFEDVPRDSNGTAIIADPRNDENMIISGLHAAFIKFHNNVVDLIHEEEDEDDWDDLFREARNETRWHWQYLILHEFLPLFVGQSLVDQILERGRRYYRPPAGRAFMPVEFQTGVYRFGHSMVRPSYRANFTGQPAGRPNSPQFFGFIFDPAQENVPDSEDLRGGSRAPRRFIGWPTFFDFGDGNVRPNKLIDTKISTALFHLPLFAIAGGDPPVSLPQRNLLRHVTWSLPSGQAIADEIDVDPLSSSELAETGIGEIRRSFLTSTPLWFYILHEALKREGGLRLGPVGGRVVAEVIIGLIQEDPSSFVHERRWQPRVPISGDRFRMIDLLNFGGVSGVR